MIIHSFLPHSPGLKNTLSCHPYLLCVIYMGCMKYVRGSRALALFHNKGLQVCKHCTFAAGSYNDVRYIFVHIYAFLSGVLFFLLCSSPHTKSAPSIFSVQGDLSATVPTSHQPWRDICVEMCHAHSAASWWFTTIVWRAKMIRNVCCFLYQKPSCLQKVPDATLYDWCRHLGDLKKGSIFAGYLGRFYSSPQWPLPCMF